MAGGLFGKPFALNPKCIVFSIIVMILFMYKPSFSNNISLGITLFIIFVISYVAMAWYDAFFDCRILPLQRGEISFTGLFKPSAHQPEKQIEYKMDSNDMKKHNIFIYLSHLILVVPLLVYIGIYKKKINPLTYPILIVLAIFTAGYHGTHVLYMSH